MKLGEKIKMKMLKNKIIAITISIFFMLSMTASMMLIPNADAHSPPWSIPTYAYMVAEPNPIGVGQTIQVYMWLDEVYGAAGGSAAALGTNASSASAALTANNYRFKNYNLTVIDPNGKDRFNLEELSEETSLSREAVTSTEAAKE
jgi:hypothetical protein